MLSKNMSVISLTALVFVLSTTPVHAKKKSSLKRLIDYGVSALVNYGIHKAIEYTLDSDVANASVSNGKINSEEIQTVLTENSRSEQERTELAEATFSVLQYYEHIRRRDTSAVQATWLDPFSDIAKRARDLTEKYGAKCDVNDGNKIAYRSGWVSLAVEVVCYESKSNVTYQIDYHLHKVGEQWKIATTEGRRLKRAEGWYRVVAQPHLNVRDKPKLSATTVGKVGNDSQVKILRRNGKQREISGRKGYWANIEYQGSNGWVFDAWLERVN